MRILAACLLSAAAGAAILIPIVGLVTSPVATALGVTWWLILFAAGCALTAFMLAKGNQRLLVRRET